ncbi:uncharacterized protein LY89DRAFT_739920 [Mollisia scopiformis]|uniref:Uncharacterized protein n=1 Tax=Mollisia scopiformis TaxID=149040 RepID=A0A194WSM0_MOLSC|nr:uncharacterized protein LY89DRAFT_739920 [Mollisia scopiformis]KUJ10941.1 hypothetical protein LY89DRAFT_739920 [Mollisia scopiformis]
MRCNICARALTALPIFAFLGSSRAISISSIRANSTTSDVAAAIEHWNHYHIPLPNYFDDKGNNFEESGTLKWYNSWMYNTAKQFPDDYKSLGESRFFAVKILNTTELFDCAIVHNGCDEKPALEHIVEYFSSNETATLKEIMENSRRKSLELSSEAAVACKVFKAMINIGFDAVRTEISSLASSISAIPGVSGPIGAIASFIEFKIDVAQRMLDLGIDLEKLKGSKVNSTIDFGDSFELRLANGYAHGVCDDKDETPVRKDQMQAHIGRLFPALKLMSEVTLQVTYVQS